MIKDLKSLHNEIPVPDKMNIMVEDTIKKCMNKPDKQENTLAKKRNIDKSTKKHHKFNINRKAFYLPLTYVSCFLLIFIISINTSHAFAQSMMNIPVLNKLCEIFTFREYIEEDEYNYVNVKIPNISNTNNTELEKRVNYEIMSIIQKGVDESKQRAREYYDAFISTGGKKEDFTPIDIVVDYEIKSINEKYTSFSVYKYETLASAYQEFYYYNIDMESGKELTLRDLLGTDYINIIADDINNQIENMDEDRKFYVFDDVNIKDLINEDRSFYINTNGKVVVVFNKYEIAAGAFGIGEFVINADIIN